jgi:hypothetical protein
MRSPARSPLATTSWSTGTVSSTAKVARSAGSWLPTSQRRPRSGSESVNSTGVATGSSSRGPRSKSASDGVEV